MRAHEVDENESDQKRSRNTLPGVPASPIPSRKMDHSKYASIPKSSTTPWNDVLAHKVFTQARVSSANVYIGATPCACLYQPAIPCTVHNCFDPSVMAWLRTWIVQEKVHWRKSRRAHRGTRRKPLKSSPKFAISCQLKIHRHLLKSFKRLLKHY